MPCIFHYLNDMTFLLFGGANTHFINDFSRILSIVLPDIVTQWTHLRRFAIDSTSKFHAESSSRFHQFFPAGTATL